MDRYHWEADLPRVVAPAVVIRGERDPVVSRLWSSTLAHDLPNARLCEIPHAPHGVIYTNPGDVADILLSFRQMGDER
jgi:pimeloyl-ACP methyl ester carboxylesterase